MTITYKYKLIERPNGLSSIKSPSILVTLHGEIGGSSFDTLGLLDSGADLSVISKEIAEILHLDLSGEKSFAIGVGGRVETVDSSLVVELTNGHERYRFRIPVKVILSQSDFGMLLGRKGFFDFFKITFDQKKEKIIMVKYT